MAWGVSLCLRDHRATRRILALGRGVGRSRVTSRRSGLVAVPSAPDESCRRHGGLPMRLPRPSAAQPLRLLVGIAGAKIALKSAAVQPFHECTGVKVTTRPANHRCSERDRAPRQPAKTKKSSRSTQPQECSRATRQRRDQASKSHSQKKWTPSAAPTPTARRRCPAKAPESTSRGKKN